MPEFLGLRIYCLVLGIFVLGITLPKFIGKPIGKPHLDMIELEWARTSPDMEKALSADLAAEKKKLDLDSFGFVPAYLFLFFLLANHIRVQAGETGIRFFVAIIILAVTAVVADWVENRHILRYLTKTANSGDLTQSLNIKYIACLLKWGMIAIAVLLTSLGFFVLGKIWVGAAGLVSAALLAVGVMTNQPVPVEFGFSALGWVLILAACLL